MFRHSSLKVERSGQHLDSPFKNSLLRSSPEPCINPVLVAEILREVALRRACSDPLQHCFQKHVGLRPSRRPLPAHKHALYRVAHSVGQDIPVCIHEFASIKPLRFLSFGNCPRKILDSNIRIKPFGQKAVGWNRPMSESFLVRIICSKFLSRTILLFSEIVPHIRLLSSTKRVQ